jgi:hypothetical protein
MKLIKENKIIFLLQNTIKNHLTQMVLTNKILTRTNNHSKCYLIGFTNFTQFHITTKLLLKFCKVVNFQVVNRWNRQRNFAT